MVKKAFVTLATLMLLSAVPVAGQAGNFSFFITSSPRDGANLGGLDGADRHCQNLAYAVGFGDTEWRAYLSAMASGGQTAVNARDRIGTGPWYNFRGVMVARDVTDLHSENANITKATVLTERGASVNGRGDTPNQHDILTGSNVDGTVYTGEGATAGAASNCSRSSASRSASIRAGSSSSRWSPGRWRCSTSRGSGRTWCRRPPG
jgi:hypothetical protein